ncbi:hypothetical protein PLESTM_001915400 [Pleodorina starrii]|nr:hypothetical protein PLESTM_001915400 [Pleodorina starrii]
MTGDSLSDNGNTFRAAGVPDSRIYWHGRYSDGPNWVDYLQGDINEKHDVQIFNYAYGGATACQDITTETFFPFVKNLTSQIVDVVADVTSGKIPTGNNVKLVPVQWIGSNDILVALTKARLNGNMLTDSEIATTVTSLITCRITGAAALARIPGVRDVVLVPLPAIHASPMAPAAMKPMIKQLVTVISQQMAIAVADLQSKLDAAKLGVTVHLLGDSSWIETGMQSVRPPYKTFNNDAHPETRFHSWFALKGFLPRMRQLRLLP